MFGTIYCRISLDKHLLSITQTSVVVCSYHIGIHTYSKMNVLKDC